MSREDYRKIPVNTEKIAKARQGAKERVLANYPEGCVSNQMYGTSAGSQISATAYMGNFKEIDEYKKINLPDKLLNKSVPQEPKTEFKIIEEKRKISW